MIQDVTVEDRSRAECRLAGNLPEDILGLGASAQIDMDAVTHRERLRYLENPDIVGAARERDISGDINTCPPFVKSGSKCHPADITRPQFRSGRQCSSRGIGVSSLHIAYRRGHSSRRWNSVTGGV